MKEFSVTILGSSAAIPTKTRNLSGQLINHAGCLFLVDCGEGTQFQLLRSRHKIMRLCHVFISHMHGDHFYGLIGLISTMHMLGRTSDLNIYGPPQLEQIIRLQLEASVTTLAYQLKFHITHAETKVILFESDVLEIWSFPLSHRVATTGFLFAEKPFPRHINRAAAEEFGIHYSQYESLKTGADYVTADGVLISNSLLILDPGNPRSYAYCSDTGYDERIATWVRGVTLLYHEATFLHDRVASAREKMHATATDAATIAKMAGAGKLMIGHFSARYDDAQLLVDEAKLVFENTNAAEDGITIEV